MEYTVIPPCDELKNYVSHFWIGSWAEGAQASNSVYYIVANSLTELAFGFKNNQKPELLFSVIQGQTYRPNQFPVAGYTQLLGVSLYSYAIPSLFSLPASDLNNECLSLDTFLGTDGNRLSEKIATVNTTQERLHVLTDFFKRLLSKQRLEDQPIQHALSRIKQCNGNSKIADLADDCCLSQKQFVRRFSDFVGLNPKAYARIVRFESFLKHYPNCKNLTEAGYASGFFDQAHLIHEFKTMTGFRPKDFWKLSEVE